MSDTEGKARKGLASRLELKIERTPLAESAIATGRDIRVYGRVRNGGEVGEWFALPAKYLELSVSPDSFAVATVELRAEVAEINNLRALIQEIDEENRS